jgi:hypothetical protein
VADSWEWKQARWLAVQVREAGGFLHRDDADVLMGGTSGWRRQVFGLAYGRRWVDVCGPWLVSPPRGAERPERAVPGPVQPRLWGPGSRGPRKP